MEEEVVGEVVVVEVVVVVKEEEGWEKKEDWNTTPTSGRFLGRGTISRAGAGVLRI